jgi:membrane associated rhomboid family serine protease
VIPLKDDNPTRSFPVTTILLIAVNIAVFAYEVTLPDAALQGLILSLGAVPSHFKLHAPAAGLPRGVPWLTLLTSMFLHGGFLHVGGNMLYLWIFGDNVEDAMGHLRFLAFYLLCGTAAGLFQIAAMPLSRVPLVGASGAIAGVLGAYVLLYPAARVRTLVIFFFFVRVVPIPALFVLGFWFLMQVFSAPASGRSGVAFFAHIGGFLTGMLLIGLFRQIGRRRPG